MNLVEENKPKKPDNYEPVKARATAIGVDVDPVSKKFRAFWSKMTRKFDRIFNPIDKTTLLNTALDNIFQSDRIVEVELFWTNL